MSVSTPPGSLAGMYLAAIVENSDDAIISKDLNGIITSWNAGAERLFGYTAEEAIKKPITIIIPPDRYHEEQQILDRMHSGEQVEVLDTVRRRKDGALVNVSLSVSPVKHADGRIVGASKIARDISERVRNDRRRLAQYTVASLLAGSWTLDEAAPAILQTVSSIGDWALAALWVFDDSIGRLRCRAYWHSGNVQIDNIGEFSQAVLGPIGQGVPGPVVEINNPTSLLNVVSD